MNNPFRKAAERMATQELRAEIVDKIGADRQTLEVENEGLPEAQVPSVSALQSADPRRRGKDKSPRKRRRKPTHDALLQNAREALQAREVRLLETPEEAIALWRSARLHAREKSPLPRLESHPQEGEPYEVMVAFLVEETEGFEEWRAGTLPEAAFMANLAAQLPQEIPLPWSGLCGAEQEALYVQARADLAEQAMGDRPAEEVDSEVIEGADGRLLPGMKRIE